MSVARISIFLARRASLNNAERPDDEITITPIADDFKIVYKDGPTKIVHFVYASENEVLAYVDDLFRLLQDDVVDPFKSIQFVFPCFPSVLYNMSDLNNNTIRHAVRDRLLSVIRNWPETLRTGLLRSNAIAPEPDNTHLPYFFTEIDYII